MLGGRPSLAASLNSEGAHAAVEMASIHSHQFCRAADVAFGFRQLSLNELAVVSFGRSLNEET